MLSRIPFDLEKINMKDVDKQLLRDAIIAELDAVNLYEQIAQTTENENIKKVLMDVVKEEKTHIGEFYTLLSMFHKQQVAEMEAGEKEVQELIQ